jgi:hypothetical protein
MNYSTAIFLINPDNVRAISTTYDVDSDSPGAKKAPRVVFKTFDQSIKVGDLVVVPSSTRHKMTVVKVAEVDVDPDLESTIEMSWIVARVDRHEYEVTLANEGRAIKVMRDAEKTHQREELKAKLMAHVDAEALSKLAITHQRDAGEEAPQTPKRNPDPTPRHRDDDDIGE